MVANPPFTIVALGPFGPVPPAGPARLVPASLSSMDDAVAAMDIRLTIPVPRELCPKGAVEFRPVALRDFRPTGVVRRIPWLSRMAEALAFATDFAASGAGLDDARFRERWPDLVPPDFPEASPAPEMENVRQPYKAVDDILSMVAMPNGAAEPAPDSHRLQSHLEQHLGALLAHILADASFRACESIWRGVETIIRHGPVRNGDTVKLELMTVTPESFPDALAHLAVHLAEDPPNLMLIDLPFDHTPASLARLEKAAEFAENLLVPTALWISARFFQVESWHELSRLPYLSHYLEDAAYAPWRKLREHPGAPWLAVLCNRFLARLPYGEALATGTVPFQEERPLWISPVWALGTLVAESVVAYGWPSRFTDYVNIALEDLPVLDVGGGEISATEFLLSMDRLRQFTEAGIIPLTPIGRADSAGVPRETTLAGASLKGQLFLSRVIGFLFRLRESVGRSLQEDPSASVAAALQSLFDQTGHNPPADLAVRAAAAGPGERVPLWISFTPPPSVLPADEPIELTFLW
jgi:type VI secretion system protein ImpC